MEKGEKLGVYTIPTFRVGSRRIKDLKLKGKLYSKEEHNVKGYLWDLGTGDKFLRREIY